MGRMVIVNRTWWAGVSALGMAACLLASPAFAQGDADDKEAEVARSEPVSGNDIVVTGTRLGSSGFNAPTPVTVMGADRLERLGITNVADGLNQVPSFRPTSTTTTNGLYVNNIGSNFPDLRGLGAPRTLVLVDGRRFVPSNTSGLTDLNLIPSMLVARSEVVTGGASAAYGSDAVSGVVNLILDTSFTGVKGQVQTGISERGDNQSYQASLAAGFNFADGRGHLLVGGEYYKSEGIGDIYEREWGREEWQIIGNPLYETNGLPRNIIAPYAHTGNMAPGGVIISGPLRGVAFNAAGQTRNFQYGEYAAPGNLYMAGGEGAGEATFMKFVPLSTPLERFSVLAHLDYDFSETLSGFVEGSFGRSSGDVLSAQARNFVPVATALNNVLTIARDNPFLPANLVTRMTDLNLASVQVGRISNDIGPARGTSRNETLRVAAGLKGSLGAVDWDIYYQYGQNQHDQSLEGALIVSNFRRAVDAVRNGNNDIVCRINLTTIVDPGCVAFNPIGENQYSQQALDYVTGTAWQDLKTDQHVIAANVAFEPVKLWAGPLSVALGGEYRKETAFATVDDISRVGGFQTGNVPPIDGAIQVYEGYLEVGVPLLRNSVIAEALDVNAAIRRTHYNTSGSVTTWKVGGTWDLVDGVRFRGARSRDIRAPNMNELFTAPSFVANSIVDPRNSLQTLVQVQGGGNPQLQPEVADTYTMGVVLTPTNVVPGLRLSVDYYNIAIAGAIGNLGPQNIITRCFNGLTEFCPLINDGAGLTGTITSVFNGFLNVNELQTAGVDFELLYDLPLSKLSAKWDGDLTFRTIATYVDKMVTIDAGGTFDRAGQTGIPVGDFGGPSNAFSGGAGVPRWTIDGMITLQKSAFGLTFHGRYIAPGKFGAIFVGPGDEGYDPKAANSISNNRVEGRFYLNLSAQYDFNVGDGRKLQLFGVVNNLFDRDPPVAPGSHVTNPVLFDVVGRAYKVGLRFSL